MSDALSEASRSAQASIRIAFVAETLRKEVTWINNRISGVPGWVLEDLNDALREVGLEVIRER